MTIAKMAGLHRLNATAQHINRTSLDVNIVCQYQSGGLIFPQDGACIQVIARTHVRSTTVPARKNNPKRKQGARERFKLDEKKADDKKYLERKLQEGKALGL